MTLADLVPSLEVCQQLKAAGFPQDTALRWCLNLTVDFSDLSKPAVEGSNVWPSTSRDVLCAAPTAEEILKKLPPYLEKKYALLVQDNGPSVTGYDAQWYVGWYRITAGGFSHCDEYRVPDNPVNSLVLAAAHAYLWWKKEVAAE
jgi:hypothetical protein